ncbi:hypothetical protein JQS43_24650 [Natronosporangium hydrolyticum]|uniref:Putative heavy-metal chelation domain-containing protein n=1 Tax=Natronosporangium hydrolyticum TaxID=2811111 RepID=A0A895YJ46_9ACTN|nr:DUF364 domain-containing protein [Natronosporangium hydrolyticum]QSB14616.1 hypothetical protein JQS43_24650 [Natronosporangium hydrolyticum]
MTAADTTTSSSGGAPGVAAPGEPAAPTVTVPDPVAELAAAVRAGQLGPDPTETRVSVGFVTRQGAHHPGRGTWYRNQAVSLRVGAAVGSCAVEPGEADDDVIADCAGRDIHSLLDHPTPAVRFAALDAYLLASRPHAAAVQAGQAEPVTVPAGDSLTKSLARAQAVVGLLPVRAGQRVLVVGVVNSLLAQLRRRGVGYLPCDRAGGETEWGEPVLADAADGLARGCDALLVSGMTLGNGSFPPLLAYARRAGVPLVVFAQTGSGVVPRLLRAGVTAASAEPYPFFWLHGEPTVLYHYRSPDRAAGRPPADRGEAS